MIREIAEHRSVRNFKPDPIDPQVITQILGAAVRASNTGNMQVYSIVATTSEEVLAQLRPCHFNQPASRAPLLLTFCVDIHRFSMWCERRGAKPRYDNFAWLINGSIDALLASQNAALEAEAQGLGICYLGTTIYTAEKISDILNLPGGVLPVATIAVGWPADNPPLTDRLPLEAVVHYDTYKEYTGEDIDRLWHERENSDETQNLLEVNGLPNLARIFTEKRYTAQDNLSISESYLSEAKRKGFFNH